MAIFLQPTDKLYQLKNIVNMQSNEEGIWETVIKIVISYLNHSNVSRWGWVNIFNRNVISDNNDKYDHITSSIENITTIEG